MPTRGIVLKHNMNDASIRRYAIYWDKIDLPSTNLFSSGLTKDEQFLEKAGVLTRTNVLFQDNTFDLTPIGEGKAEAPNYARKCRAIPFIAFEIHEKAESGTWSVAQEGRTLAVPKEYAVHQRAIEVELCNALPEPDSNVPLEKVLEFKMKRNSELSALRGELDDMYQSILASADFPRARVTAISRIEMAVSNVSRAMGESFLTRQMRSMKVEVGLKDVVVTAAAGAATGEVLAKTFGLPLEVSVVGGAIGGVVAVLGSIKFVASSKRMLNLPADARNFAYLYHAMKEVGAKR